VLFALSPDASPAGLLTNPKSNTNGAEVLLSTRCSMTGGDRSDEHAIIVERLWRLYAWPEVRLPMRAMTVKKLLKYRPQPAYVSDETRTWKQPRRAWDYGRIRFFYDQLLAGHTLDAIEIGTVCDRGHIYPEPIVLDGHHRLAASKLAHARTILASYGGRVDLRDYLTGRRPSGSNYRSGVQEET
jgi:hypothetical protein